MNSVTTLMTPHNTEGHDGSIIFVVDRSASIEQSGCTSKDLVPFLVHYATQQVYASIGAMLSFT
jgi:hypothetical protein